jgi:LysM repeat protein
MRKLVIASALAAGMLVPGMRMVGALQERPEPTVKYVVRAGDTLWTISERVDPDADRRAVVYRLMELNDMDSPTLLPGQTLELPAP